MERVQNDPEPDACTTCEEVIALLKSDPPPVVIRFDIGLSGMSTVEGGALCTARRSPGPIIILTMHDDSMNGFTAACAGASRNMMMNSSAEKFFEAVGEILAGAIPMSSQRARKALELFSRRNAAKDPYGLTGREKEILKLAVDGMTKKKIAERLFLSFHTVNTHMKNIYGKLHVHTRAHAVSKACMEKLL